MEAAGEGVMTDGLFNGAAEAPPLAAVEVGGDLGSGVDSVATADSWGPVGFTL